MGAHGSSAWLEVTAGPARGHRIALSGDSFTIGRGEQGPGRLENDPELSREHARIRSTQDGLLLIEDLDSRNGTFVNGGRIPAPTVLRPGDEITVGTSTLKLAGAAQPRVQPPPQELVPARARKPALRVVEGWAPGTLIRVGDAPVVIGRGAEGSSAFAGDSGVAEEHARLSPTSTGGVVLEDLGSEAGTLVGGRPIPGPTVLAPGDRFQVGDSVMEVVLAAGEVPADRVEADGAPRGGVRRLPDELFRMIGARAPVTRDQVVRVAAVAIVLGFIANYAVRELAIHALDISGNIASLEIVSWILQTVLPVVGNSIGFYKIFRRPDEQSVKRYLAPTFGVPIFFVTLQMFRLEHHGLATVLITIWVTVQSLVFCATLMLRLRARVARSHVATVSGRAAAD